MNAMEFVDKGSLQVVGLRVVAPWQELWTEVPKAWREIRARSGEIRARTSDVFVDVSVDQTGGTYTQVVGAEVSAVDDLPEGMVSLEIPARRYLHHRHRGPVEEIADSFGRMYTWASERGHELGAFKLDVGYTQDGGERSHDLYVQVVTESVASPPAGP